MIITLKFFFWEYWTEISNNPVIESSSESFNNFPFFSS